jgi:hypothetical protein
VQLDVVANLAADLLTHLVGDAERGLIGRGFLQCAQTGDRVPKLALSRAAASTSSWRTATCVLRSPISGSFAASGSASTGAPRQLARRLHQNFTKGSFAPVTEVGPGHIEDPGTINDNHQRGASQ